MQKRKFCFTLGYQIEHFQLRLHFQAVIFSQRHTNCFPLWLLLSAANLFKLPESQKLQDSYTNTQTRNRHKEKHRERERERERGACKHTDKKQTQRETQRERERERERCVILGRGRYGCKGVDDASEAYRYRNGGE